MNYQLLKESYLFGIKFSNQEIELLSLKPDTYFIKINISKDFGCFKSAPSYICEGLNLRKGTLWMICFAVIEDIHKLLKIGKTKIVKVNDLLLEKALLIG
tara:strand:- start:163 stop:462 length:300 start_codon:yes stop_codon:yes gene_type:complete